VVADPVGARLSAFARQARREPVHLPGHVVVDLREAQGLEPARGSRTHVSQRVRAVDDHRIGTTQSVRLLRQIGQRDVDRAGDVLLLIRDSTENLDELPVTFEQRSNSIAINRGWHSERIPVAAEGYTAPDVNE
jgi:hypothetical protein